MTVNSLNRDGPMKHSPIITDTREQKPWWKTPTTNNTRHKLIVGDYTTTLLKGKLHVERKSPQDLYQTIVKGRMRFLRELERAEKRQVMLVIIVECDKQSFISKKWKGSWRVKASPGYIATLIKGLEDVGAEFLWAENVVDARRQCKELFALCEQELKEAT